MAINDGGPVNYCPPSGGWGPHFDMTLRDYFAGQVVAGFMAYPHYDAESFDHNVVANIAVGVADALIAKLHPQADPT